jgi:hypothetical protein
MYPYGPAIVYVCPNTVTLSPSRKKRDHTVRVAEIVVPAILQPLASVTTTEYVLAAYC